MSCKDHRYHDVPNIEASKVLISQGLWLYIGYNDTADFSPTVNNLLERPSSKNIAEWTKIRHRHIKDNFCGRNFNRPYNHIIVNCSSWLSTMWPSTLVLNHYLLSEAVTKTREACGRHDSFFIVHSHHVQTFHPDSVGPSTWPPFADDGPTTCRLIQPGSESTV